MESKIAKIEALANNQEYVARVTSANSEEEMISVMAEYGIELTANELKAFLEQVAMVPANDELNEDMLSNVNGGGRIWNWIKNCLNNWFNRHLRRMQTRSAIFSVVSK